MILSTLVYRYLHVITTHKAIGLSTTWALAPPSPITNHMGTPTKQCSPNPIKILSCRIKSAQKGSQTSMPRDIVTSFLPSSLTLTTGGGRLICKTMRQHVVLYVNQIFPDLSAII